MFFFSSSPFFFFFYYNNNNNNNKINFLKSYRLWTAHFEILQMYLLSSGLAKLKRDSVLLLAPKVNPLAEVELWDIFTLFYFIFMFYYLFTFYFYVLLFV